MAGVYAAQEAWEDAIADVESQEDVEQALSDLGDAIEEVAEEYGESADNIEDGFGHETYVSEDLREKQGRRVRGPTTSGVRVCRIPG